MSNGNSTKVDVKIHEVTLLRVNLIQGLRDVHFNEPTKSAKYS